MTQNEQNSGFWLIADAVKRFYATHNCLPLTGSVPDMKAQSKVYIQLQNIYKAKARQDAAEVLRMAQETAPDQEIDAAEVDLFCKNAAFVKLINATGGKGNTNTGSDDRLRQVVGKIVPLPLPLFSSSCSPPQTIAARLGGCAASVIPQRWNPPCPFILTLLPLVAEETERDANAEFTLEPLSLLPIYLAMQATRHVASASADKIVADVARVVPGAGENERVVQAAQEVARAEGGELHNIAALTGGMVAQEMIKIITKQYIPIDNTCIFDGISSRSQVLRL